MELAISFISIYLIYLRLYYQLIIFQILLSIYIWSNEENNEKYKKSIIIGKIINIIIKIKEKINVPYYSKLNQEYILLIELIKESIITRFIKREKIEDNKYDKLNKIMLNTFNMLSDNDKDKIYQNDKLKEYINNINKITNSNIYKQNIEDKKLDKLDNIIKTFLNKFS